MAPQINNEKVQQLIDLYNEIASSDDDIEVMIVYSVPDDNGNRGLGLHASGSQVFLEEILLKIAEKSGRAQVIHLKDVFQNKKQLPINPNDIN